VPYDERADYLLEADIGVSAHFDDLETHLAFRQRFVDHIWASLPTLTTRGSALSDLVGRHGIGRVVDYSDVNGWVQVVEELAHDAAALRDMSQRTARLSGELRWSVIGQRVGTFLQQIARDGGIYEPAHSLRSLLPAYFAVQARLQGPIGTIRKLAGSLKG
jgi:hypothetical protein